MRGVFKHPPSQFARVYCNFWVNVLIIYANKGVLYFSAFYSIVNMMVQNIVKISQQTLVSKSKMHLRSVDGTLLRCTIFSDYAREHDLFSDYHGSDIDYHGRLGILDDLSHCVHD